MIAGRHAQRPTGARPTPSGEASPGGHPPGQSGQLGGLCGMPFEPGDAQRGVRTWIFIARAASAIRSS